MTRPRSAPPLPLAALIVALLCAGAAATPAAARCDAAARAEDGTGCGKIIEDSSDALVTGKPPAEQGGGDDCGDGGKTASGSRSVFINGQPMIIASPPAPCADR